MLVCGVPGISSEMLHLTAKIVEGGS